MTHRPYFFEFQEPKTIHGVSFFPSAYDEYVRQLIVRAKEREKLEQLKLRFRPQD